MQQFLGDACIERWPLRVTIRYARPTGGDTSSVPSAAMTQQAWPGASATYDPRRREQVRDENIQRRPEHYPPIGNETRKTEPSPITDSTPSRPLCASIIERQIDRPIPIP